MSKPGKFLSLLLILSHTTLAAAPPAHKPLVIDPKDFYSQKYLSPLGNSAESHHKNELPEIGDPSGTLFTPTQEKELGEAFFRSLHGQAQINQDPEVEEYIQSIGQKLAANSDNPSQSFHFFVVNDPVINAFAGPGGYIGVNSGLILTTDQESELASVLGHEIAHVTQRHIYQALQASGRIQLISFAAMLAAAFVGSKMSQGSYQNSAYCTSQTSGCERPTNTGQGLAMAAMGAGMQAMINFTRDNEAEADSIGMQILSRSDFDPRSMPTFFERMQQSTRYAGHHLPEFLLTHPVTVSRISETRDRAEKFPYRQYPDGMAYQLVRAKLRVQTWNNPQDAVSYFRSVSTQGVKQQQEVSRYGLGLALIAANQAWEGKNILLQLVREHPEQPQYINALAKAEMSQNNFARALELYSAGRERFPENRAIKLNYVQALLITRKPGPARLLLEEMLHGVVTPEIYEMMAQAYSGLNNEAESHRYLAEAYYAAGNSQMAILQLKLARRYSGNNYYLSAIIDDRLKKLTEEEKDRRKDK